MDTLNIDGKEVEITGYAADGLPIIKGVAVPIEHKDAQGNQIFDEDGNPKISTIINVPAADLIGTPGKVS
jgi:hypothetical protein